MDYKDKFYSKYVSSHAIGSYGKIDLDAVKKQFPIWNAYFRKFLPKDEKARIIDIGCGNGSFVCWLKEAGYGNSSGIDFSDEQIKEAEKMGIKDVFKGDIRTYLRDKTESFDLIFARDVFEHFPKQETVEIIELIHKSLKTGGILVVQTVNAENIFWGRIRHGDFTHETAFTRRSVNQLFLVAGFKNIKVYPQAPIIHGLKSLIRVFLWKVFELLARIYLMVENGSPAGIFTQNIIAAGEK